MARKRKKLTPKANIVRRGLHFRKVPVHLDVGRYPRALFARSKDIIAGPFVACVKIGGETRSKFLSVERAGIPICANGKNPRKAITAALHKAAGQVSRRAGAFAGL